MAVMVALVVFGCIGSVYSVPSELECTNLADESPTLTEIKACLAVDSNKMEFWLSLSMAVFSANDDGAAANEENLDTFELILPLCEKASRERHHLSPKLS
jgi:hypothetical protein